MGSDSNTPGTTTMAEGIPTIPHAAIIVEGQRYSVVECKKVDGKLTLLAEPVGIGPGKKGPSAKKMKELESEQVAKTQVDPILIEIPDSTILPTGVISLGMESKALPGMVETKPKESALETLVKKIEKKKIKRKQRHEKALAAAAAADDGGNESGGGVKKRSPSPAEVGKKKNVINFRNSNNNNNNSNNNNNNNSNNNNNNNNLNSKKKIGAKDMIKVMMDEKEKGLLIIYIYCCHFCFYIVLFI
jgi:hypothetical protein